MKRNWSAPIDTNHAEWLGLIETAGVFFAIEVLDRVFPQGLEKVDTPPRQRLRAAYDEWRDAVDEEDLQLTALHREWVRMVLEEGLEYSTDVLVSSQNLEDRLGFTVPESGLRFAPDFALHVNGNPELLIIVYPPGVDLERTTNQDNWMASPFERMTTLCRATNVRLGLITNGERWMLVRAPVGGVSVTLRGIPDCGGKNRSRSVRSYPCSA